MEWDGEIFVDADRIVARCLLPAPVNSKPVGKLKMPADKPPADAKCDFSIAEPKGELHASVKVARDRLTAHRYLRHKALGHGAKVNLIFGHRVTV